MANYRSIRKITETNISDGGTEGTKVALGTTAQRGSTRGQVRYNSTLSTLEYYDGTIFHEINTNPTIISSDVDEIDSAGGGTQDINITGTNFKIGVVCKVVGNDASVVTANTTSRTTSEALVANFTKASFANSKEPYDIRVENSDGAFATLADYINVDNAPTFTTAAGSLGTLSFGGYEASNVTNIVATDPEESVTLSVVSGTLPPNFSLSSSGVWSGTTTEPGSDTTFSFTVRATAGGKTTDRAFSITVNIDNPPTFSTAAGSLGTLSYGGYGAGNVTNVVATDPDGDTVTLSVVSGSVPPGLSINSSGVWSGTATEPSSDTTSNFTMRASSNSKSTDRAFSVTVNHRPKGTSANPGLSCQDIYDAGDGGSAGNYYIRPNSTTVQAYCDSGWTLVVRMNNQGSNSQNTTSAYNGIPQPGGNTAKLSHSIMTELVDGSSYTNPTKVVFCSGVTRYINGGYRWVSSNRNKGASWATSTSTTSYNTHCGSASSPNVNNGGGGEWASNSVPWPYMDGQCQKNGGFSTGGNCCGGGNGDAWGNFSGWSGSTGCGSTGRSTMNIWTGG